MSTNELIIVERNRSRIVFDDVWLYQNYIVGGGNWISVIDLETMKFVYLTDDFPIDHPDEIAYPSWFNMDIENGKAVFRVFETFNMFTEDGNLKYFIAILSFPS